MKHLSTMTKQSPVKAASLLSKYQQAANLYQWMNVISAMPILNALVKAPFDTDPTE